MNGKKEKKERKLILVRGQQSRCVPATHVMVGSTGWLACLQRVAWWQGRGGAGCSGDGRLCQGGGNVVGVAAAAGAAATRLGTTGSVSCVGDGAVQWQIRLRAASGVVVGERGWPSCARGEGDGSDVVSAVVLHRFEMRRKKRRKKKDLSKCPCGAKWVRRWVGGRGDS